jgi:hypothetical protein
MMARGGWRAVAKRTYSDEEKASALAGLAANGGNVLLTARQAGVPRTTLRKWADGVIHPSVAQMGHEKREDLAGRLEDLAHRIVDAIPGRLSDADLKQLGVCLGIAVDKMRLLREQPTSIEGQAASVELVTTDPARGN